MEQYLELGQIVNTFGIKGQIKVNPFTANIRRFEELKEIYIEKKNELKLFEIEQVNYSKNTVILKLKGIESLDEAEKLRNCYVKINRKDVKKLPEGTYYIVDLIGLEVYTDENKLLRMLKKIVKLERENSKTEKLSKEKIKEEIQKIIEEEADKCY